MPPTIAIDARKAADFGIGTYVRHLIAELARIDETNRYLLLVGEAGLGDLDLPDRFRTLRETAPGYSLRELVSIPRRLRAERVDLFHSPHYVLPPGLPCPAVVTVHDVIHLLFPTLLPHPWLGRLYARAMIGGALRRSRRVLTVSLRTKRDLVRLFRISSRKIRTVHNGVDFDFFARGMPTVDHALREAAGFGRRPYLLFVGNAKPHKNLATAGRAWEEARRITGVDLDLVVLGSSPTPSLGALRDKAAAAGLATRLLTPGRVDPDTLAAGYRGAQALLAPSLYEGFGLPLLEAMAAGVPVVASNAGALPEIAGGAADLCEPLDAAGYGAAVARLLDDPDWRRGRIEAGRRNAQRFSWARAAEKTLAVYLQALRGGDGEAPRVV